MEVTTEILHEILFRGMLSGEFLDVLVRKLYMV